MMDVSFGVCPKKANCGRLPKPGIPLPVRRTTGNGPTFKVTVIGKNRCPPWTAATRRAINSPYYNPMWRKDATSASRAASTNMTRLQSLGLLLVPLVAFACSSGSSTGTGGGGGGGGSIAIDQLSTQAVSAICDMQARCGAAGPFPFAFSSAQACRDAMGYVMEMDEIDDVNKGLLVYHADQAAKCLTAYKSAPCETIDLDNMSACELTFTGNVDDGAACTKDDYCKSTWCQGLDKPSYTCPGVCAPPKKADEACTTDDKCEGALVCTAGKCAAAVMGKDGEACEGSTTCEAGLKCIYLQTGPVCKKLPANGEACLDDDYCAKGSRCSEGKCAAPAKAGEACSVESMGSDSAAYECEAGLNCAVVFEPGKQPVSTCMTGKNPGEACTALMECIGLDQTCTAGKCAPLPKTGEDCLPKAENPIFQCGFGLVCAAATGKCGKEVKATEGQDCSEADCADGLMCKNDKCDKMPVPVCK